MKVVKAFVDWINVGDLLNSSLEYHFTVGDEVFIFSPGSYRLHPKNHDDGFAIFRKMGLTNVCSYMHNNLYSIESSSRETEQEGVITHFPESVSSFDSRKERFLLMLNWLYGEVDKYNASLGMTAKAPRNAGYVPTSQVSSLGDSTLPVMVGMPVPNIAL